MRTEKVFGCTYIWSMDYSYSYWWMHSSSGGHNVHAGPLCLPEPDCKFPKIEHDSSSGFCVFVNLLSDGVLHLSPVDGHVEAAIDALVSCQQCVFTHCKAVDEAHRHTYLDGLPDALGQTTSGTDTAQFL